ncbi:MAG: N-acetylmuramoyl-L-alanine amidase [Rhodospirillales bacterium]
MRRLCSAVPVALLLSAPVLAQMSRVTAVRFWSVGDVTRVAIETSTEVDYRCERIPDPDRLFIDLNALPQPGRRGVETIPVGDPLLKQIRIALTQPEVTRVVLDLAAPVEYSLSQLRNPNRIIVELRMPGALRTGPPERSVTGSRSMEDAAKPDPAPERPLSLPPARAAEPKPLAEPPALAAAASVPETKPLPSSSAPAPQPPPPPAAAARKQPPPPAERKAPPEKAVAAKADSTGRRSLIRALGLKLDRVVLDPGHGGHDTGTIGPSGLQEKTLVLDVAKRLGELIEKRLGSEVIYTRTDDTFVSLEDRTRIANEHRADLFLSIHANSSRSTRISGAETFYLNFTTSADALEVAARENATSQKSIYELQSLLKKIALKEKVQESREFASAIQKSLQDGLWKNRAKDRGVKQAPFIVLIGADMPSVLTEIAFLSNPRDEAQLMQPSYRQKVAECLFQGLSQYAASLSRFEVARGE